jgi:hypothetical protein
MESDKYPAHYDTAPKLLHEEASAGMLTPGQQYQQPWSASDAATVSALSPNSEVPWQSFPTGGEDQQTYVGSEPKPEKRICGIRKRLFIIIAAIVGVVVIAAAIGGGVGGSRAANSSSDAQSAETASTWVMKRGHSIHQPANKVQHEWHSHNNNSNLNNLERGLALGHVAHRHRPIRLPVRGVPGVGEK